MQNDFKNEERNAEKVALVTGGAKRIGAKIVGRLHEQGYHVLIHCNQSASEGQRLADSLNKSRDASAHVVIQDLSDTQNLQSFVEKSVDIFGRLDCLVNNASIFFPTPANELTSDEIDQFMAVNLKAPLLLSTAAASKMQSGSIINIVDIYGEKPLENYLAYCISKAALVMATKALAQELAPAIRVNGVSPGAILWPEDAAEMSKEEKGERLADVPMKKLGEPDDIAQAVVYLAEQGTYVTGQIISVDGGQSIA